MDKLLSLLTAYWWILIPILLLVMYKWVLRVLFGMIIIPENKIGLVTKKFVLGSNKTLPNGRIIATDGEAGFQIDPLAPGIHWGVWIWQYDITQQDFISIPTGSIGLVSAKDSAQLPTGQILARSVECNNFMDARAFFENGGQKGKQVKYLNAGTYRINTLLFEVKTAPITVIGEGKVGIITAQDGKPLSQNQIAGNPVEGHNNFQDFDTFLEKGGQRGLQTQFILAGSYSLNSWAVTIEQVDMVEIAIGNVGIVISYVGDDGVDTSGTDFKHGNIVAKGQKGVWNTPLDPGKYPINNYTTKLQIVPTTNLVLNWANARTESHNLDKNLNTITVRSKDGFPFNLDVSQIIHIPSTEAPKVIARFGSIQNLVSQVLEPTIGNYFRNSAQDSDVIAFLSTRKERQDAAKERISAVLEEYNVHAVDTLIGDIVPPAELMKTLTDRKIAQEEKTTYGSQIDAQKIRQTLKSETALADMQTEIVTAQQSVQIAEKKADAAVKDAEGKAKATELAAGAQAKATELAAGAQATATKLAAAAQAVQIEALGKAEASKIENMGKAEATKIESIGDATAKAYELQVKAMGADNFSRLKFIEQISNGKVKIIPEILINGGGDSANSGISGLLGVELLSYLKAQQVETTTTPAPVKQLLTEATPPAKKA